MVGHIVRSQKYVKIAKIAILARNSIFDTAADIGQNDDIVQFGKQGGYFMYLQLFAIFFRNLAFLKFQETP